MKTLEQNFAFLTFIFCLFFSTQTFSQVKNLGIKIGLDLSNGSLQTSVPLSDTKNKIGFNVTAFYDFLNFRNIGMSVEAGYAQKGYKDLVLVTNELGEKIRDDNFYHRLDYIDISLIGKIFLPAKYISPYFSAGPVLSYNTGYRLSTNSNAPAEFSGNILGDLNSTVFGLKLGTGAELKKIIPLTIIIEGRYNLDLSYSYDKNGVKYKNRLFEFNAGIKF